MPQQVVGCFQRVRGGTDSFSVSFFGGALLGVDSKDAPLRGLSTIHLMWTIVQELFGTSATKMKTHGKTDRWPLQELFPGKVYRNGVHWLVAAASLFLFTLVCPC